MNLVDGVTTFPVLVGNDASLARSEDVARRMEAVGRGDLAAVVARNLSITQGLCAVDALLLVLCVQKSGTLNGGSTRWRQRRFQCRIRVKRNHNRTVSECQ